MHVEQSRTLLTVFVVAAVVARIQGQDGSLFKRSPTQDTESESHQVTLASPVNTPNHQPASKAHGPQEHQLAKDFQSDQQFSAPNLIKALDAGDPATELVPHEDAPAFSEIVSSATVAATSPLNILLTATSRSPQMKVFKMSREKDMTKSSTDLGGDQIPVTSPPSQNSWSLGYLSESVNKEHDEEPRLSPMTTSDYLLHKPTTKSQVESTAKVDRVNYTTTTSTTTLGPCGVNFTEPEGDIEITQQPNTEAECFYLVTVYLGYGIEVQVLNVSVLEEEEVTVEDTGGSEPFILAKDSALKSGLVLRSQSNQITVRFTSGRQQKSGFLLLHYQASMLSCSSPRKPSGGEVSVTHLHVGGEARFHCFSGYTLQGPRLLMCHNATTPYWSGKEPQCIASCGGLMKNATYGRITTPGFPGNYSNNLTCHWVLEVPEGHRLHIHFEKVALAEDDDRFLIKNGDNIDSPPIYDSYEVEYLPVEGVLSTGRYLFIEFTTDATVTSTGVAIRYEGKFVIYTDYCKVLTSVPQKHVVFIYLFIFALFAAFANDMCYEPFIKYGNFTSSYPTYRVGTTVEFSCDPGYTLEQGAVVIECVNPQNPQWNETEPACRAVCSGEVTDSAGVVLSPNWPEAYDKGQDCIWGIHVEEDKRIMLDIQVLHLGKNDLLKKVHKRWFIGINRNWFLTNCLVFGDAVMKCLDPGNVEHSHKVISGGHFTVGATVQFICNKGYVLSGSSLLTCCNRDLAAPKWSERLPKCVPEKYEPCRNPGAASTSVQNSEKAFYQAGETLSFSCHSGYELQGQATIYCIPGHPSLWNSSPPACRASSKHAVTEHKLDVVYRDYEQQDTSVILVVLIPSAIILAVILGIYVYFSKLQGKTIRMPTSLLSHERNTMEESSFDNPAFQGGVSADVIDVQDVCSQNTSVLS
ncbi:seizure protein 6 homolog [Cynoglossus semilaevis]|uniref:seizure protein 6 homolog n=1 Tax=Cynoglossus semilaevis TaxID=244447 RepID=UPI000D627CAF|nr:seizure protein 6 homolog [Cynoglossus semilaevis]